MSTLDPRDRTQLSVEDIYRDLKAKLGDYTPDFELRIKAELAYEVNQLKVAAQRGRSWATTTWSRRSSTPSPTSWATRWI